MKVLVVSHSPDLAQSISFILKVRWPNLSLIHVNNSGESLELIHREQPDIVMYHLPEQSKEPAISEAQGLLPSDCLDFVNQIRSSLSVPLIIIRQDGDVMDKVKALEMGADDWMSPDVAPMEFIARVNAILRRCSPRNDRKNYFLGGKLAINCAAREVFISDKKVKLTPIQYKLLCHLIENQGKICSSIELLRHVWGPSYSDDKELLKLGVYRLRSKIEKNPANPEIVLNERGVGYVIKTMAIMVLVVLCKMEGIDYCPIPTFSYAELR
jgi:two-component system KDP operon response regulator KdpE